MEEEDTDVEVSLFVADDVEDPGVGDDAFLPKTDGPLAAAKGEADAYARKPV